MGRQGSAFDFPPWSLLGYLSFYHEHVALLQEDQNVPLPLPLLKIAQAAAGCAGHGAVRACGGTLGLPDTT